MVKFVRVNTDTFETEVDKALATGQKVFVLFFGTELAETNESWCIDCVIADPLIRKALIPISDAILIEAPVGLRNEWKGNTTHPYRLKYDVPAIPTLYKWSKSGPGARLVESEAADIEKLNAFVEN